MQKQNLFHSRAIGNIGEDIACKFLVKKGFNVILRNYQRKWGELDIIAQKDNAVHFFEVKSVTYVHFSNYFDVHRPEDNVNDLKIKHIRRMIETYMNDQEISPDAEFHFHVLCVYLDMYRRKAHIKWIRDIIL